MYIRKVNRGLHRHLERQGLISITGTNITKRVSEAEVREIDEVQVEDGELEKGLTANSLVSRLVQRRQVNIRMNTLKWIRYSSDALGRFKAPPK